MGTRSGTLSRIFLEFAVSRWRRLLVCALMTAGAVPAPAGLVINELLPDPEGSDAGREFVELMNTGPGACPLANVVLQFANGAVGPDWVTRWSGTGYAALAPGERFLIVDRNWQGSLPGDSEAYLGLQNGPDAIRLLVDGAEVLDLVGYGPLTDAEMFEGIPVALRPGSALARRPDGHDSDINVEDFVPAEPTPGAANFLPFSVAVTALAWDPPVLSQPWERVRLAVSLRNEGTEVLPAGPCRLTWGTGGVDSWWDVAEPGAVRDLTFLAMPNRLGVLPLVWTYAVPGADDTLAVALLHLQVGVSELRLNEVLPAPDQGQGEWFELQWRGDGPGSLAGYQVRDEDGGWQDLPPYAMRNDEIMLIAQDSLALRDWLAQNRLAGEPACAADLAGPAVLTLDSWPALNNSVPSSRAWADRLYLADPSGVIVDAVAWGGSSAALPPPGRSLERIEPDQVNPGAAGWMPTTARSGSTPGCRNSVVVSGPRTAAGAGVTLSPPWLDRASGMSALHLQFTLRPDEGSWELQIFNLWGDCTRDFGGDRFGPGPRDLAWDGRDDRGRAVAPGMYLACLVTRAATGNVSRRAKTTVVVR